MITPQEVNLTIYQGATYRKKWKLQNLETAEPIDLSGYTARMHIREKVKSLTPMQELTTENGGITITVGEEETTIELYICPEDTASYSSKSGVYDLELIDIGNDVYRLIQGSVTIKSEVTR